MVIFPLFFFIWVILFLVMGGGVAWSVRRKHGTLGANFRKGFLICLAIAIVGPLIFRAVQVAARKQARKESLEQKPVHGGTGSSSPSGGAVPPGDSARPGSILPGAGPTNNTSVKDTSYHVATPPKH